MRAGLSHAELQQRFHAATSPQRRSYYQRILNGLCVECNHSPVPGRRRCEVCAVRNLERIEVAARRKIVMRLIQEKHHQAGKRGYWPEGETS